TDPEARVGVSACRWAQKSQAFGLKKLSHDFDVDREADTAERECVVPVIAGLQPARLYCGRLPTAAPEYAWPWTQKSQAVGLFGSDAPRIDIENKLDQALHVDLLVIVHRHVAAVWAVKAASLLHLSRHHFQVRRVHRVVARANGQCGRRNFAKV